MRTLGHFRVQSLLGKGGMGEVYLAEDLDLRRKVALKILPAEFTSDEERLHRFEREARAASSLNHPNILTIYEIGRASPDEGGAHYIATEYVEGETLRSLAKQGGVELRTALHIASQAASALDAAHTAGIIHRDIKPENIMVRGDGLVKVLDFGLAKLTGPDRTVFDSGAVTVDAGMTEPGLLMGTVAYMSPEQARGLVVDVRTDIFSLGVVLYEMIAGTSPFAGTNSAEMFAAILKEEPLPLEQHKPGVPLEVERIVSKALRKDRNERYQTIKDLLIDLQNLKQELEFTAKSGQLTQRTSGRSALTRRKQAALAACALLLITAAVLFYFSGGSAIDSVAILPFVNTNADANVEYLAAGIPEGIISSLSLLPNLKVMSRNSAFQFKGPDTDLQEVGRKLGVRAVLTGRVMQRGDSLVISAELVDVRDNRQLWGQQYSRPLADVFAMQEEMAREISENLRLKLSGEERQQLARLPTENLQAFQDYMQGRTHIQRRTREDLFNAVRYYEMAIGADPKYALAYAGLADAYVNLGVRGYIPPIEGQRKAQEAAGRAIALDGGLAEAHVALAQACVAFAPCNFAEGDREYEKAIELSPSLALAHQYLAGSFQIQGRLDEALREYLKARELDPLSAIVAQQVAYTHFLKRDHSQALEQLRKAHQLGPAFIGNIEIQIYIQHRLYREALAELQKAERDRKSDAILIFSSGMLAAAQGRRTEALQTVKQLEQMSGDSLNLAQPIARIYASLNDEDLALRWLERAAAAGAIGIFYKDEPVWDAIRRNPRFSDMLRRIGVPV